MKTRVIQDDPDEPTTHEDRAEAPVEQERSTNLAGRMTRWSAHHRKKAVFGFGLSDRVDETGPNSSERRNMMTSPAHYPKPTRVRRRLALSGTILAGLAAAALLAASAIATPQTTASTRAPNLQEDLDALVAAGVPGAILVIRDGKRTVSLASGLGNVDEQTPMRPGDRFRIASHTKTYVATVVLQLVSEGKLRLEDTVEQWLPGLVPNGDGITIRQLLNHTSGLFDYENDPRVLEPYINGDLGYHWAPRELVRIAASHEPLFEPGATQSYSNTGYILAGLIIRAATGNTLRGELSRRIFQPLDLRATSFPTRPGIKGRHAHGYIILGEPPAIDITGISPFVWAAGAIVSTGANDLSFYRALLSGRLIRAGLLREMKETVPVEGAPPGAGYGLGLTRAGTPCGIAWGHNGAFGGFYSDVYTSENGRHQALLMVNLDKSSWTEDFESLFYELLDKAYCSTFR
jgi:D-alanyl-D-alanine carboxypeptidase